MDLENTLPESLNRARQAITYFRLNWFQTRKIFSSFRDAQKMVTLTEAYVSYMFILYFKQKQGLLN